MHVLRYFRRHVFLSFALLLAVGVGTSYAFGTIHTRQTTSAANAARAATAPDGVNKPVWAYVDNATVTHTTPSTVATIVKLGLGDYKVYFPAINLADCARVANLTHIRGYVTVTGYDSTNPEIHAVRVRTSAPNGDPVDADFVVVVFCGSTSGQPIPEGAR